MSLLNLGNLLTLLINESTCVEKRIRKSYLLLSAFNCSRWVQVDSIYFSFVATATPTILFSNAGKVVNLELVSRLLKIDPTIKSETCTVFGFTHNASYDSVSTNGCGGKTSHRSKGIISMGKNCPGIAVPSGNRTRVVATTMRNTNHCTNETNGRGKFLCI